jgi:hypothetical protein
MDKDASKKKSDKKDKSKDAKKMDKDASAKKSDKKGASDKAKDASTKMTAQKAKSDSRAVGSRAPRAYLEAHIAEIE